MSIDKIGPLTISRIAGCEIVPVSANRDERGCLYEIFRETWPGAFRAVQWNACASDRGVVRGAHVHVDYHEFYTLPRGEVIIGLSDIRRESSTFGRSAQFYWGDRDAVAFVIPPGVAHVVFFQADSVLAFGLSGYWDRQRDVVGCQFDAPEFGFTWPEISVRRSARDISSGTYSEMLGAYGGLAKEWQRENTTLAAK
jgi:dTDP-4-dehydrorhamnose 3,5-epimerase